jgi:putative glycosyltransferase (TIGR04372 family)
MAGSPTATSTPSGQTAGRNGNDPDRSTDPPCRTSFFPDLTTNSGSGRFLVACSIDEKENLGPKASLEARVRSSGRRHVRGRETPSPRTAPDRGMPAPALPVARLTMSPIETFFRENGNRLSARDLLEEVQKAAPHLPSIETLEDSYFQFPRGTGWNPDYLVWLEILVFAGRSREASNLLHAICFRHWGYRVPLNIGRRLYALLGIGIENPSPSSDIEWLWLRRYMETGVDQAHPATLEDLRSADGRLVAEYGCPSCGGKGAIDPALDSRAKEGFLCTRCLARLEFPREETANAVRDAYLRFLSHLPRSEDGSLAPRSVADALAMARLVRPFLLVRFGTFFPYFGHMLSQPLEYIRQRARQPGPFLDIVGIPAKAIEVNAFATEYVSRIFDHVSPAGEQLSRSLPPSSEHNLRHALEYPVPQWLCCANDLHKVTVPKLCFTPHELARGRGELEGLGIPSGAKFACLHVRTGDYHGDLGRKFRNSEIATFRKTIQFLVERGFHVVRLGAVAGLDPLPLADHPKVVDYANGRRSGFMDVFLMETCDLMIGTGSGIDAMRLFSDKPTLFLNFADFGRILPGPRHTRVAMKGVRSTILGRRLDPLLGHLLYLETDESLADTNCLAEDLSEDELLASTRDYFHHEIDGVPYPADFLHLEARLDALFQRHFPTYSWNSQYHTPSSLMPFAKDIEAYLESPQRLLKLAAMHVRAEVAP